MEVVAEFELLEVLHLSRTRVSDRGILRLQGLTRMRQLSLAGCDISDACFPAIACMTALTDLNCEWCADVSSACLQYIRLLPQLKVSGTPPVGEMYITTVLRRGKRKATRKGEEPVLT